MKRKAASSVKKTAGMSDEAVKAATGKTWPQWCAALDKHGARKMTHKEIVAIVSKEYGIGPWWQQMVTVGYENATGLRKKHEMPDGYQISRSKTLPVSIGVIYKAWSDGRARARWLKDDGFVVRKATANRSMRITWLDRKTTVEVMFYPKGAGKAKVTVQHNRLPSAAAGEKMKKYWGAALDRLAKNVVS